jgi:uncharacterized protein (DUF1015 family)
VALVSPFRAVRYASGTGEDISALTAPPYDVIGPELRAQLLERDAHNVVALELAEGPLDPNAPDGRYATAGRRWREWLEQRVLTFDEAPAIYVLEQTYRRGDAEISRRGFIAAIGLEPFSAGVVLPHERTLPKALDDRLNVTRATAANLSQVFGMFEDADHVTDALIERAMATPLVATATDDEGVTSRLWALTASEDHATLAKFLSGERIFIADGHHRYTTALAYRDERRAAQPPRYDSLPAPAYDSVMMALVNMEDPGLIVYPTHRVADAPAPLDPAAFREALGAMFDLTDLPPGHPSGALQNAADRPSFIVRTRDGVTKLARLRDDLDVSSRFPAGASDAWKGLDVAVLQELVLAPLLDIHPDRPATMDRLAFVKEAHAALALAPEHDAVFILNPTRMEQVAAVALAGETMPQKSTYFYPKLLSGLLFKSLETP